MWSAICCPGQLDRADHQDTQAAASVNVIGNLAQPNRVVLRRVDFRFEIASFHPRTHPRHLSQSRMPDNTLTYLNISERYFIINDEGQVFQCIAREVEIEPS